MESAASTHSSDAVPPASMFSLVLDQPESPYIHEFADAHKTFRVRCADTDGHRSSVSMLVDKMYAWRQYESSYRFGRDPNRIVLVVLDHGRAVATSSLGLDSGWALSSFRGEVESYVRRFVDEHKRLPEGPHRLGMRDVIFPSIDTRSC